jgi:hypothetical protein
MRRSAFILLLGAGLLSHVRTSGQSFDDLVVKKAITCEDVEANIPALFQRLYSENKLDSAQLAVQYWESICGRLMGVRLSQVLLQIRNGDISDPLVNLDLVINVDEGILTSDIGFLDDYPERIRQRYTYLAFLRNSFIELTDSFQEGSVEHAICSHLGGSQSIFGPLRNNRLGESEIQNDYSKRLKEAKWLNEFQIGFTAGAWIPTGSLRIVGSHPSVGLFFGLRKNRFCIDGEYNIRFAKSPNDFPVRLNGNPDQTILSDNHMAYYVGLFTSYALISRYQHELHMTASVGYETIEVWKEDVQRNPKSEYTSTYGIGVGPEYRFYFNESAFIGFRPRVIFSDYLLSNTVDFTGWPIMLDLRLGIGGSGKKTRALHALRYPYHVRKSSFRGQRNKPMPARK